MGRPILWVNGLAQPIVTLSCVHPTFQLSRAQREGNHSSPALTHLLSTTKSAAAPPEGRKRAPPRAMNTDITASVKPEYPVVDRNPAFTKVVGNFSALDYLRLSTISAVSVTVGYLSGIKPGIRGPSMVTGGLIGVLGGFMYAYQNSAGRLMGFFPNESEVARYKYRLQ